MIGADWMQQALCREVDPELFFPDKGSSPEPALSVCARCPVVDDCREWILRRPAMGVWGGLSAAERERLGHPTSPLRVRLDPICGTPSGAQWHERRGEPPCGECLWAQRIYRDVV